ncbi:MAG: hypothetical protein ACLFNU_04860 [Bacteroidales bacterium]
MNNKLLLTTAEMGLGHLRALKPFEELFKRRIHILGQDKYSSQRERFLWRTTLRTYEWFSKAKQIPIIGTAIFSILDKLLEINESNSKSKGNNIAFQVKILGTFINQGACKELKIKCETQSYRTILTSFYAPVHFAAKKLKEQTVFCQICDTDISRVWVPQNPKAENIQYFAPCAEVVERLKAYGVCLSKIHLVGFPLPIELVGGKGQEIAIDNYTKRLSFLQETRKFSSSTPLRITYVIGGAGAMVGLAKRIAKGLKQEILNGSVVLTIVPNPKKRTISRFIAFKKNHFNNSEGLHILNTHNYEEYFKRFSSIIVSTHLLWTKPSELTFYSSLGIPIIMAPPLGAQEIANREWLIKNNIAIDQANPETCKDWLLDLLESGLLWPMAKNGWVQGRRIAVHEISDILNTFDNENSCEKNMKKQNLFVETN